MREIKFRCWNGEQMVSPDYIDRNGVAHWKENSIPTCSKDVMWYTGSVDKKKSEIFEGDYFREEDNVYVCYWVNEIGVFTWLTPDEIRAYELGGYDALDDGGIPYNMGECSKIVIAGNICQKPGVLTEFKN